MDEHQTRNCSGPPSQHLSGFKRAEDSNERERRQSILFSAHGAGDGTSAAAGRARVSEASAMNQVTRGRRRWRAVTPRFIDNSRSSSSDQGSAGLGASTVRIRISISIGSGAAGAESRMSAPVWSKIKVRNCLGFENQVIEAAFAN